MSVQAQVQQDGRATVESCETIVIGGGQAGLSVGYHLARLGRPFLILDGATRVGDSWRARWDSMRLFTPARRDGLPGMPFPAPRHSFPTGSAMADAAACAATRSGARRAAGSSSPPASSASRPTTS
jgi:putative flavoprotein involved in K+ transport